MNNVLLSNNIKNKNNEQHGNNMILNRNKQKKMHKDKQFICNQLLTLSYYFFFLCKP